MIFFQKVMGKYYRRASSEQRARFANCYNGHLAKKHTEGRCIGLDADRINVLPFGPSS